MISEVQPDTKLPKKRDIDVYVALIYQTGTSQPTVKEFQNTFGQSIVWNRDSIGQYRAFIAGSSEANTTIVAQMGQASKLIRAFPGAGAVFILQSDPAGAQIDGLAKTTVIVYRYNNI